MVKVISLINHENHYFIINSAFNLSLIIIILVKSTIFIKKAGCKLKDIEFINFY